MHNALVNPAAIFVRLTECKDEEPVFVFHAHSSIDFSDAVAACRGSARARSI
jgi:hypothetical protein